MQKQQINVARGNNHTGHHAWTMIAFYVFVPIVVFAIMLDMYPVWVSSSELVRKEIETAEGIHKSSTCMFYRNELTVDEIERFGEGARKSGDKICVEANFILKQNVAFMKFHRFAYRYMPFASGGAFAALQNTFWYLTYVAPVVTCVLTYFWPMMSVGNAAVTYYAKDPNV